jgi:putative FmdB family regulatory protein
MPIYEYKRPDGSTFEIQQAFSDEALTKDPETGVKVQRVLHAPAVHFKGKGFYNTDYGTRNRQRETAAAGEGSSDGASGSKDGGSQDGKAKDGGGAKDGGTKSGSESGSAAGKAEGKGTGEKGKDAAKSKPVATTK